MSCGSHRNLSTPKTTTPKRSGSGDLAPLCTLGFPKTSSASCFLLSQCGWVLTTESTREEVEFLGRGS